MEQKITATTELDTMLVMSVQVGCYQDQMTRFLQAGYIPQAKQLQFHAAARECDQVDGPEQVAIAGTRGQAKSHAVYAQAVLDDMQRYAALKVLYLRKIGGKAQESFEDLRRKLLQFVEHDTNRGDLYLPNGSFMVMGGFRSESDIDNYLGLEYDLIVMEDATALTKSKYDVVCGSKRTSRDDYEPRMYLSFNPGGVGHSWAKKLFYDPWKRGQETATRFIHVTMGDNVFINPRYEKYLKGLTGWLKRAWCDGDFEISAGQFFITWDEDIHVIEPFDIPRGWRRWCALDYGFTHWNVVYLFAEDGDGNVYVVDEHAARRWLVPQHVTAIDDMMARNNITRSWLWRFVAGPDVFAHRGDEGTIAEKYEKRGIKLEPAQTDRISGAAEVLARLGSKEQGIMPTLFVFNRCRRLIECLPLIQHDPHRPEDVLKVNCDPETGEGGDDEYDTLRYGLMAVKRKVYQPPGTAKYV